MGEQQEHTPYKPEVSIDDVLDEAWLFVRYGEQLSVNAERQLAAVFVQIVDTLAKRIAKVESTSGEDPSIRQRLDALCEQFAVSHDLLDDNNAA